MSYYPENKIDPTCVGKLNNSRIISIASSSGETIAITDKGEAYGWGGNFTGVLGFGNKTTQPTPKKISVSVTKKTINICINSGTAFALLEDGNVYACGYDVNGKMGGTGYTQYFNPIDLP